MTFKTKGGSDEYRTPQWLFDQLNARFNFDIDVACTDKNRKNTKYKWQDHSDGLTTSWGDYRIFCNPPFSNKAAWMRKMNYEVRKGSCPLCVMILPMCLDTKAFNKYIDGIFHWEHLPYRVSFLDENNKPVKGNPSGTIIIYAWKKIQRPTK